VQGYMTWSEENFTSIARGVAGARENARSIREVVSLEVWEAINELHLWSSSETATSLYAQHREVFYQQVRRSTQLTLGLLRSTMLHDDALDFIWLGVLLERTSQTARILDVHHHAFATASAGDSQPHAVLEVSLWLSLLRACYGFESFMKSHRGQVTAESVAAFLLWESRFPRSVRHCLRRVRERLAHIRPEGGLEPLRAQARLSTLESWLEGAVGKTLDDETLHAMLTKVVVETDAACDDIAVELLAAAPLAQQQSQRQGAQGQSQPGQSQSQGAPEAFAGARPGRTE